VDLVVNLKLIQVQHLNKEEAEQVQVVLELLFLEDPEVDLLLNLR
jgi:hypothetical protein